MPYKIEQTGPDEFVIRNLDTGKVVGHSKTRKDAEASVRARYASENMPHPDMMKGGGK